MHSGQYTSPLHSLTSRVLAVCLFFALTSVAALAQITNLPPMPPDFVHTNSRGLLIIGDVPVAIGGPLDTPAYKEYKWQEHLLLAPALAETNFRVAMPAGYVVTNGNTIYIDEISFDAGSGMDTPAEKQAKWRDHVLMEFLGSHATNALDVFVQGAWLYVHDNLGDDNGYNDLLGAMDDYESAGQITQALALARQLIHTNAPESIKILALGHQHRLNLQDHPLLMHFTALDGRAVDLAHLRGKVVLLFFWGTDCIPCRKDLAQINIAYAHYHAQGFEAIGLTDDTDKSRLKRFIADQHVSWPQYFDDQKTGWNNPQFQSLGITGTPHLMLIDKQGRLRFDNVRVYTPQALPAFEAKIQQLLAEK
jgi:peroxiredoxin